MTDAEKPASPVLFWGLIAAGVAFDQLTKLAAWLALSEDGYVKVVPCLLYLTLRWNPGMAFSLGATLGNAAPFLLALVNCVIIGFVIWFRTKGSVPAMRRLFDLAMGLVLAGAIGNIVDRVHPPFMVIDFLDFWIGAPASENWLHWPTFNVADIFIVAGVGVYLFWAWRAERVVRAGQEKGEKKR